MPRPCDGDTIRRMADNQSTRRGRSPSQQPRPNEFVQGYGATPPAWPMRNPAVYMDPSLQASPLFGLVARDMIQRQPFAQSTSSGVING